MQVNIMKLFSPIVFITRKLLGDKKFIAIRTWTIKKHIEIINKFSKLINLNNKGRQNLILLAKRNGKLTGLND